MQVILPVAGLGTRLRPHTWSRPKPLVAVAGKTILDHVLDRLSTLPVERVVFVTGYLGEQIAEHVRRNYQFDAIFVEQPEPLGQSHAILQAKGKVSGPTVVMFPDMIFEANVSQLDTMDADGAVYVMPVDDPRRFGVVILEDGRVVRLVEKPVEPVSNLAVMGIYYFREVDQLMAAIETQIAADIKTKAEYFLADAIQLMIDGGANIRAVEAEVWEDCGTSEALLGANRYLLARLDDCPVREHVVQIPPVYIAPTATVRESVIGPYASIGAGATVVGSIIRDSIVDDEADIRSVSIAESLIGKGAVIRRDPWRVNVGDNSTLDLSYDPDRRHE
jgi:glucose-1-phosphate thymidylyltransferase